MRLSHLFSNIRPTRLVVMGDLLLDRYTTGAASRISPEAPVAVVHVNKLEDRPGGAGNVALNLQSLGSEVVMVGRRGEDLAGKVLLEAFESMGISTKWIVHQGGYPTSVKNRIIADNQQMMRLDYEEVSSLCSVLEDQLIATLPEILQGADVLVFSDYGKGFLTDGLLAAAIAQAQAMGIPTLVDPKGIDFSRYRKATLIKPNYSEALRASNLEEGAPIDDIAQRLLDISSCEHLLITRSSKGISLFHNNEKERNFPVEVHEVKDVTGAGDTVLATLSWAIANELSIDDAVRLSNIAAGIAIEHIGCKQVSLQELAEATMRIDSENKVFDDHSLFAFKMLLKDKKTVILSIGDEGGVSTELFSAIQGLSKDATLILYLNEKSPSDQWIDHLSSLHEVDWILKQGERIPSLLKEIAPEEIYQFEGRTLSVSRSKEIFSFSELV